MESVAGLLGASGFAAQRRQGNGQELPHRIIVLGNQIEFWKYEIVRNHAGTGLQLLSEFLLQLFMGSFPSKVPAA